MHILIVTVEHSDCTMQVAISLLSRTPLYLENDTFLVLLEVLVRLLDHSFLSGEVEVVRV